MDGGRISRGSFLPMHGWGAPCHMAALQHIALNAPSKQHSDLLLAAA
jgi:hypothetical protein